jgi:O-antigen/teichoic acid export membrane protein
MLTVSLTVVAVFKLDHFVGLFNIVVLVVTLNMVLIFQRLTTFKPAQRQHEDTPKGEFKQFFIFGLQTFPAMAIRSFHLSLDLLLLGFLLSPTKLSEYAICITIGGLSSLPLFIYSIDKQVRFKDMSLRDGRSLIIKRVFGQFLPISIGWSFLIFSFAYFSNGDFIFSISTNAMIILILLMLANIVDGVVLFYSTLAISNGFNNQNTRIQASGFFVNIIAMVLLVPHFLGIGAAVASLVSYSYCLVQLHKRIY